MTSAIFLIVILVALWLGWWSLLRACERANEVDWGNAWLNRLDGLNRIFCRKYHRLEADDVPLPETGCALLVANHVSGLDPLLMYAATRRRLHFMIAREQYDRWPFHWLFRAVGAIPVERHRRPEQALREAMRALEAGKVIALFPHGRIHLDSEPPIRLKGGVLRLASYADCPICPLRVEGVRGQGLVVSAVWLRSRARIKSFAPMRFIQGDDAHAVLLKLAEFLDGRT